jgi:hypothetical protein
MSGPQESLWRTLWQRSAPLDRLTIGYLIAFAAALALLGRDDSDWAGLFAAHLVIACAACAVVWFWHAETTGVRGFIRALYPAMLYSLFYSELERADHWIFPSFLDQQLVAFERAIFGVDPNLWIINAQSAWLNEIMMLGYFSYYLLIPIVALTLFFRKQTDDLRGMLYGTTVAFVISYIGFVVFPVEGPRYYFAEQFPGPLSGWVFVPLVRYIIDQGAIHGGCMPSSHVAVALVILFWARRTLPRMGSVLTPFVFFLILGTAWGRFHYVTDAVVGIIVVAASLWVTGFWSRAESHGRQAAIEALDAIAAKRAIRERA